MERKHFLRAAGLAILGIAAPTKVVAKAFEESMGEGYAANLFGIESSQDLIDIFGEERVYSLAMQSLTIKIQARCRAQARREMEYEGYDFYFWRSGELREGLRSRAQELVSNYQITPTMFDRRPRKTIAVDIRDLAFLDAKQIELLRKSGVRIT